MTWDFVLTMAFRLAVLAVIVLGVIRLSTKRWPWQHQRQLPPPDGSGLTEWADPEHDWKGDPW